MALFSWSPQGVGGGCVLYTGVYHIIGHVLQFDSDVRLASPLPPFWPLAISFDAIFLQLTCLLTVASIRFSINFYAAYRTQPSVRSCVIKTLIHFSLIESKKKKWKKKKISWLNVLSCHLPRSEPRLLLLLANMQMPRGPWLPLTGCQDKRDTISMQFLSLSLSLPFPTGTKRTSQPCGGHGACGQWADDVPPLHVAAAQIVCAACCQRKSLQAATK